MKTIKPFAFLLLIISCLFISCSRDSVPVSSGSEEGTPVSRTQIISPAFGEIWEPGTLHKIKWSFYHGQQKVDIILYRKTELKSVIAVHADNTGEMEWRVPEDIALSVHYRFKIENSKDSSLSVWSDYFYVKTDTRSEPD